MPCTVDVTIERIVVDINQSAETIVADINQSAETVVLEIQESACVLDGGDGNTFARTAGAAISALIAVYELPDGTVWPLSADDDEHIDLLAGITLTSASTGAQVTVQRSGPLDAAGLNLQAGRVWLGMNGQLTQTPPDSGNDTLLGYATAEQRLYIDISETIILED